jgi:hypothetical protein
MKAALNQPQGADPVPAVAPLFSVWSHDQRRVSARGTPFVCASALRLELFYCSGVNRLWCSIRDHNVEANEAGIDFSWVPAFND